MLNPFTQSRPTGIARIFTSLAAILFSALCTGCWVQSVYPFYSDTDIIVDTELAGTWLGDGELKGCVLNINLESSTRTYTLAVSKNADGNSSTPCQSATFEGKLIQIGGGRFIDMVPDPQTSWAASLDTLLKLNVGNQKLALTPLDPEWVANALNEKAVKLEGRVQEFGIIPRISEVTLVSTTDDLRQFLREADAKNAFRASGEMHFTRK